MKTGHEILHDPERLRLSYPHGHKDAIDPNVIYVTPKELSEIANCSLTHINNCIKRGDLKALWFKRKYFIHPDDAEQFVKAGGHKKPNNPYKHFKNQIERLERQLSELKGGGN